MKRFLVVIVYCIPVFIALALVLANYQQRVKQVSETIYFYQLAVEEAEGDNKVERELLNEIGDEKIQQLVRYFKRKRIELVVADQARNSSIDAVIRITENIWFSTSLLVGIVVILPFFLFAVILALSNDLQQTVDERIIISRRNFIMKFILAAVICVGWIYIFNPHGRGASTIESYLLAVDLTQPETLPLYIKSAALSPTIAAFLGWYLHILGYFFTKLIHHDVVSPHVYNHIFKKFLFVYGLALVLPAAQIIPDEQMSVAMFILGFFPMSALDVIKTQTEKLSGRQKDEGSLTVLPGISHWQILRLEEEGIDTMAALATCDAKKLKGDVPGMAVLIDYWVDIAYLYSIVGEKSYQILLTQCRTAKGFVRRADDEAFKAFIMENKIGNVDEIINQLWLTFGIENSVIVHRHNSVTSPA